MDATSDSPMCSAAQEGPAAIVAPDWAPWIAPPPQERRWWSKVQSGKPQERSMSSLATGLVNGGQYQRGDPALCVLWDATRQVADQVGAAAGPAVTGST